MEAHNEIVAGVAERVKHFHALQKPFRIYHGSTNSTRASPKSASNTVDTSRLANVLAVDPARRTATAEPNVPLGDLVAATLAHGLVPLVVMEFPGITVGGGFSGSSGESSSFRHGAFDATIESIEIVLADGTVERASRTDKPDLLWGAASSFGTLGVVTLLEVRLRPASKYVRLEYHLLRTPEDSVRKIRAECARDDNDYVDGIVFAMDQTVVCTGRMVDDKPDGEDERRFTRPSDPWFYLRAQDVKNQLLKSGGDTTSSTTTSTTTTATTTATTTVTKVDYIPLVDYLFRYDRGGFWMARYAFTYFATPFNRLTRRALDRFMHTKTMYHAMHKSGLADSYVIQDVGVTWETAADFQRWLHNDSGLGGGGKKGKGGGIYPLWLCPLRIRRDDPDSGHGLHAEFANPDTVPELLNFGVWGPVGTPDRREAVRLNRALEQKVQSCGGKKWLYAQAFYTEDEFWAHYQKDSYFALREKYRAGYLPSVYDKVKVDVDDEERAARARPAHRRLAKKVWPLRGLYGVYHAWRGHDYLLQKRVEETSAKA